MPTNQERKDAIRRWQDHCDNIQRMTIAELKEQTDFFHYFSLALPNGEHIYLHIGHYRSNLQNPQLSDRYYLYSITKNIPKNMETL